MAVKGVKEALKNDGFSFVHIRFQCNENFGAYALGTRDKRLHGNPGAHSAVPPEEFNVSQEFLASHLLPSS